MAHGVPVVAAAAGAHVETLGVDGCLFQPEDAKAAGAHLANLGSDPGWRHDVGGRLRARQRQLFSIDLHVQRLEEFYATLLLEELPANRKSHRAHR